MKKLKKTLVRMAVAVGMMCGVLSGRAATYTDGDGHVWTYTTDATSATVTKVEPCEYDLVIPAEIDGKPVTSFSATMFKGNTKISSIEIPDGVTAIGANAFAGCSQLQSVSFGAGIKSIGDYAFKNCGLLLKAELPEATTTLGTGCFSGCVKLNTAKLPGVTSIPGAANDKQPGWSSFDGHGAFYNCEKLKTLQLGDKLTYIGNGAFYNCNELYDVTIPDAVTSIGNWAFAECDKLNTVVFGENLYQIGCDAFLNDVKLISVSFRGEKLRILWDEAFRNCQGLDGLVLPNGLLTIKSWCFRNCKAMKAIVIPDTVVTNEVGTFANCSALLTAKIGKGLTYIAGAEDDKIPSWSSFDSHGMFYGCVSLTNVEISANATRIECGAFYGCSALPEVVIPGKVREVKGYAFAECAMLKKVTVGDNVRLIGNNAFYNDAQLETLKLGAKVQTIQAEAFRNCTALKSFEFPETLMTIGDWAFRNCDTLGVITLPDSLGSVGVGVFARCNGLTDVLIGESLEEVVGAEDDKQPGWSSFDGYGMFCECTSLTNVHFGSKVATIGCGAFYGCSALREIDIPSCVTAIKPYAFNACPALQRVRLADGGVTSIGQYAFKGDANLESISLGNKLQSIGSRAFQSCTKLNNVVLPETLQTLGSWCFNACSALSRIEIPDSVIYLNVGAFANCPSLTTVKIGRGVLMVSGAEDDKQPGWSSFDGYGAFSGCTALKTLDLGSVMTIAGGAFYGCSALETVTIPDTVTKIAPYAFANCPSLRAVTVGTKLATLGKNAFAKDSSLHYVEFKGKTAPSSVGTDVYTGTKDRMMTYVASDSTGWTGLHQPGLPETWQGRSIAYGPVPATAGNPYDFYPYTPTGIKVSGKTYGWPGALMLTKTPYLHGSTIPATVAEFKQGEPVYLTYAFDEYWRGSLFENMAVTFALSGTKAASENVTKSVSKLDYSYCWGTNVALNILKDLAPGNYTLTMTLNTGKGLAETDYENNTAALAFKVLARASYTVTFDAHGGTPAPASRTVYADVEVGELPTVTRAGYTFNGWYTAEKDGSRVYSTTKVTANVTYHAQWTKLPNIIFWKPTDMTWAEPLFVASSSSANSMQAEFTEGDSIYLFYACYEADGKSINTTFENTFVLKDATGAKVASFYQPVNGIYSGTYKGLVFGEKTKSLQELKPGKYTLTCTLDSEGVVAEFNEEDNVKAITFTVKSKDNPGTDTPGKDNPGTDTPGKDNPGTDTPGKDNPGTGYVAGDEMPVTVVVNQTIINVTVVVGQPWGANLPAAPTAPEGLVFAGWFTQPGGKGEKVIASSTVKPTAQELYAYFTDADAFQLFAVVAGQLDASAAQTYDGYLRTKAGDVAGVVQVKAAKQKVNKKTQVATSKLTVTITEVGKKKATFKGELDLSTGAIAWSKPKTTPPTLVIGANGLGGSYGTYTIDGGRNIFTSKDASDQSAAAGVLSRLQGAVTIARATAEGFDGLSVSIAAKGKAKVTGVLVDGTKVSVSSQLIVGDSWCCVPVAYSKKNVSLAFCLWLSKDGLREDVTGLGDDMIVGRPGTFKADAMLCDVASIKSTYHLGEDGYQSLKLKVTAKTGVLTGSFKCYDTVNGKEKKVTVKINGVLIGNVGFGTALVKKVGSTGIVVE